MISWRDKIKSLNLHTLLSCNVTATLFCRLFLQEFGWTDIGNIYDTNLHLSRVTGSSLQASVITVVEFVFMLNHTGWTEIESGHTIDELRVDEKLFETVFDFHLSPDWWQMAIENIVF